jgi:enterochelin esterase-like enzyme
MGPMIDMRRTGYWVMAAMLAVGATSTQTPAAQTPPAGQAGDYPEFFTNADVTNKQLKLLWVGVGKDDALVASGSKALDDTLTMNNIKHTYRVTEGRHEWVVWRHHLHEVAPLMFR